MSRRPPIRNALPVRDFGRRLVGWMAAPPSADDGWRIATIDASAVVLMIGRCLPAEAEAPRIERCYLLDAPTLAALARCPGFVRAAAPPLAKPSLAIVPRRKRSLAT